MNYNRNEAFHNAVNEYNWSNFEDAIILFNQALVAQYLGGPNHDGLILNNIATCYTKLNLHTDAIHYYLKAIELGLINENILFSLATSYYKINNENKALETYSRVIRLNPISGKGYYLRGKCYKRIGEYIKGDSDLNKAISLGYFGQ